MKQQHFILGIIALVIFLVFIGWRKLKNQKQQPDTNKRRPSEELFPIHKIHNNRLIIIEDINEFEVKKIVQEFCNAYNKDTYQVIPRLTKLTGKKFAITFQYDINFEIYCYLINYLNYPIGFDRSFKAIGWTTTRDTDNWTIEKNKHVMLYVSDFDTEYDNVLLTTSDNIGYKLGFAMGEEKQLLDKPEKTYQDQPIKFSEIEPKQHFDFK